MKKIIILTSFICIMFIFLFNVNLYARGWERDGIGWKYYDAQGVEKTETILASNGKKFYLDETGYMVYDYLLENFNDAIYYFNDDGEMVVNTWVAVDPYQVENQMENPPSVYLYYFGNNGKAYKAKEGSVKRKMIDGKPYLFNENGQMLSGWISADGIRYDEYNTEKDPFVDNLYYAGDETDGVLRSGWFELVEGSVSDGYNEKSSLWFYFNIHNNKKVYSDTSDTYLSKKINTHTYAFDENGVMLTGWDAEPTDKYYHTEDTNNLEIGRMLRKEWVYTVPSEQISEVDFSEDVYRWFYSLGNGNIAKNTIKKINSNYYAFNTNGIMKAGIVLFDKTTKEYVDTLDIDYTEGIDFLISGYYVSEDTNDYALYDNNKHIMHYFENDERLADYGARKIGNIAVGFSDDDYIFSTDINGAKNGLKKKIYYQYGIKLIADRNIGQGLVLVGYKDMATGEIIRDLEYINSTHPFANPDTSHDNNQNDYIVNYIDANYMPQFVMVDGKGTQNIKVNYVKKDKEKRYWMFNSDGYVEKILEVEVKYVRKDNSWYYKSQAKGSKGGMKWLKMDTGIGDGEEDAFGRCPSILRGEGDYEIYIDNTYAVNFRLN